ncbi:MAG: hypothetical protein IPH28_01045 [Cytophagaceae bacterium]|nr:hypothetical protein [Cytophagaceae bacterium]
MKIAKLFTLFLLLSHFSFANIPVENLNQEFDQINKIEKYVNEHPGTTIDQLKSENSELIKNITISEEIGANFALVESDTMGIPPFWRGFCLGFWGIIIVYIISDNDKSATKKALQGCITAAGIYVGLYMIFIIIGLTSVSTGYYY